MNSVKHFTRLMMENETITKTLSSPWKPEDASYVDDWFLMGSYLQCFLILATYLAFVLKIGPYLMKDRAPFKLTNIIIIYNIIQVILSGYIFKLAWGILSQTGLASHKCVTDFKELEYEYYYGTYIYMLVKLSELLDTVFFVLRKKYQQVSFLHVYHHCVIFFSAWTVIALKNTNVSVIVLGSLNSFVHLIMYSYYTLSVFPNISKHIFWWKRYITSMQLIQFGIILMYALFEYVTTPCKYSNVLLLQFAVNIFVISYLFGDFYIKSYISPKVLKK